jgi:ribose transport system substrate-binding protein
MEHSGHDMKRYPMAQSDASSVILDDDSDDEETPVVQETEGMTIAHIGFAESYEFWTTLGNSVEEQAAVRGVNLLNLTGAEPDTTAQVEAVNSAIDQQVDAIILGAINSQIFGTVLDRASTANIPVVAVDTGIGHPHVSTLIQTDNYAAARLAGEYIASKTNSEGTARDLMHSLIRNAELPCKFGLRNDSSISRTNADIAFAGSENGSRRRE